LIRFENEDCAFFFDVVHDDDVSIVVIISVSSDEIYLFGKNDNNSAQNSRIDSTQFAPMSRLVLHVLVTLLAISFVESFSNRDRFVRGRPLRSLPLPPSGIHESNEVDRGGNPCDHGLTRRNTGRVLFRSMLMGAISWQSFQQIVRANDGSAGKETIFLSGRINLPSGMLDPGNISADSSNENTPQTKPALYVTARPNRPDNVPRAILDGSRGKPPPILAARFESPTFPFDFQLSEKDLTPEGMGNNDSQQSANSSGFWWGADDLIVSARWDSDGVAATRSPEDLVGRNMWKRASKSDDSAGFVLDLQGRGSFGKFATKKN